MDNKKISAIMTRSLVSVRWSHSMADAAEFMKEREIRHLPVLNAEGEVVGVLSDRDVKKAQDPNSGVIRSSFVVADFMSWPVIALDQAQPISVAVDLIIEEKISSVLITSSNAIVGILTTDDLLRNFSSRLKKESSTIADFSYTPIVQEVIREAGALGL